MPLAVSVVMAENEKINLHLDYKSGVSFSKVASRLQKLRFVYKYLVVDLQSGISLFN
jgi:hypothetical protein